MFFLSVHSGSHVTITHNALKPAIQGPPSLSPGARCQPPQDIGLTLCKTPLALPPPALHPQPWDLNVQGLPDLAPQTCSNLLNLDLTVQEAPLLGTSGGFTFLCYKYVIN